MKLTWADVEAHRGAASPDQWRRMKAYLHEGKSVMEIAKAELGGGRELRKEKTSVSLCIGRGCIAVLKSMLHEEAVQPQPGAAPGKDAEPLHEINDILLGMRVEDRNGPGHDAGRVESIEGDMALVAWDSGNKTATPLARLAPLLTR